MIFLNAGLAHHMALSIASVPNYKIFIFGGQQGGDSRKDWKYVKNVNCLDCGSMQWMSSDECGTSFVEGPFPEEREDLASAFDRKTGRIYIHGGWSQRFLSSIRACDCARAWITCAIAGGPCDLTDLVFS